MEGEITCECALLIILDATAADITDTAGHECAKPAKVFAGFRAFQPRER